MESVFLQQLWQGIEFSALRLQLAQTVILSLNYASTCVLCLFWGVCVGCLFLKYLYGIFIKKTGSYEVGNTADQETKANDGNACYLE